MRDFKNYVSCLILPSLILISGCDGDPTSSKDSVAELMPISLQDSRGTVTVTTPFKEEEHLLIFYSLSQFAGTFSVQLNKGQPGSSGARKTLVQDEHKIENRIEGYFRNMDLKLAELPPPIQSTIRLHASPDPGDIIRFFVLESLDTGNLITIDARLERKSDNSYIFIDMEFINSGESDSFVETLGATFDNVIYSKDREVFGAESDIDNDPRVYVLISPLVNRIGALGYFTANDLFSGNVGSNAREIFYVAVPGMGTFRNFETIRSPEEVTPELLLAVLAHEFQHMINFNQHIFVHNGSPEERWLNEALSHIAEDVTGFGFDRSKRIKAFFQAPASVSLTNFEDFGSFAERGAAYLFVRYLADQMGEQVISKLTKTPNSGIKNIESATGEAFAELYRIWSAALHLSNTRIARTKDKLDFNSIDLRSIVPDGPTTINIPLSDPEFSGSIKTNGLLFIRLVDPDKSKTEITIHGEEISQLRATLVRTE